MTEQQKKAALAALEQAWAYYTPGPQPVQRGPSYEVFPVAA
jgi:hypothetical protein